VRVGLPSQASSIVGDDIESDVHETCGGVPEPGVIKVVAVHEFAQLISGIESGSSMRTRMLDATNLVEDDETLIPRNTISRETGTDGVSKKGDCVLRYNSRGEPELTTMTSSTPGFVGV
jgi:hypothetical protein